MATAVNTTTLEETKVKKGQSPFQLAWKRFKKNKLAVVGIILLAVITLISVLAPYLATQDPNQTDLYNTEAPPDSHHLLGTNDVGQDVFSRLLYGGRLSLLIGVTTMLLAVFVGGLLGALAGYYGGWIDMVISRITDILLTMPTFLFIMFLAAILSKSGVTEMIFALAFTSWPATARIVRGEFLSLREREFVLSARAIGCSDFRIIFKHMFPNALAALTVNATLLVANMMIVESSLSYLGLGVPPTTPTWGNMLQEARNLSVLTDQPWVWIPAGVMIVLTVLSINFIGDGLRDAFDTKSTRR